VANAIYPKYKEAILQSASDSDILNGTVKAALVDTGTYTYSATHQFYSDLSGVVGTPQTIGASKSVTGGVFDGADVTYTSVTGAECEALVIYIDTGNTGTSRLVAYIDTSVSGLPVTPNGGDISVQWNASGIFAL
jgi:hypothetical protein